MRLLKWISTATVALTLICLGATRAPAQQDLDSVKADATHHKVEFENSQVRVVRWVIPPGDKTANHSHPNNVNVFLTDANVKITTPDGKTSEVHGKAGAAAWRGPTTHVVQNIGDKPVEGILIEPKKPASALPAGARDVMVADSKHHRIEFENEQVRVLHYRLEPGDTFPTHGHPDNVQVVLTDATSTVTTPDGKATPVTAKAGEVHWRPAGQHTVQNTGKQPLEGVLVEMKGGTAASAK